MEDTPGAYDLVSIIVDHAINKVSTAEIIILDGDPAAEDFPISNTDMFDPGKEIRIESGYDADDQPIFEGIVIKCGVQSFRHKPSILKVECKHEATKMTIGRKSKYYYEVPDSDAMNTVISDHGLSGDVEPTDVTHPEIVQFYTTDWDFVVSRAEANGKLVFTEGSDQVVVKAPVLSGSPSISLRFGGNMIDFEAEIDARYQYSGVQASAWNHADQAMVFQDSSDPSRALNDGVDPDALSDVLGIGLLPMRHGGSVKDVELLAWANSQMLLKSRLAKVRGRVNTEGFNEIAPGDLIELAGVGDKYNGTAFVSSVRHEINIEGWETHLQFGLSPACFYHESEHVMDASANGLLPGVNGLQIGLVTQLEEDPDGEDRVLVRIPMIDADEEGVWARVATLDAGNNRGTFFRPELGDEVVLGFFNDDPRHPVILGMMNSSAKPAPFTAADDNHEKGYVSRDGLKVTFNDEKLSIVIETPARQEGNPG